MQYSRILQVSSQCTFNRIRASRVELRYDAIRYKLQTL